MEWLQTAGHCRGRLQTGGAKRPCSASPRWSHWCLKHWLLKHSWLLLLIRWSHWCLKHSWLFIAYWPASDRFDKSSHAGYPGAGALCHTVSHCVTQPTININEIVHHPRPTPENGTRLVTTYQNCRPEKVSFSWQSKKTDSLFRTICVFSHGLMA